jgi:hypothetical protein
MTDNTTTQTAAEGAADSFLSSVYDDLIQGGMAPDRAKIAVEALVEVQVKLRDFRFDFAEAIMADKTLSPGAKHLGHVLSEYMNHDKYAREAWASMPRLAADMGKSTSMVSEHKTELIERGFLVRKRRLMRPNNVFCQIPPEAWDRVLERRRETGGLRKSRET